MFFGTKVFGNGFSRALTFVFFARAAGMASKLTIRLTGIWDEHGDERNIGHFAHDRISSVSTTCKIGIELFNAMI